MFKASIQYSVFFSRSQADALTVPIFKHTNHLFSYCVFKTRSFDPTSDYGHIVICVSSLTHPAGAYVSQGRKRDRPEAASKSSHKLFLSNSGEHSETLTSFLMRKQTSCLIELGKPEARAKGMAPRWKSMPN